LGGHTIGLLFAFKILILIMFFRTPGNPCWREIKLPRPSKNAPLDFRLSSLLRFFEVRIERFLVYRHNLLVLPVSSNGLAP